MPAKDPLILLSFDVEEFDAPIEQGRPIPRQEQLRVGRVGLQRVLSVLDNAKSRPVATLFTTGVFAEAYPELMKSAAQRHEIASHGYSHGPLLDGDLEKSKRVLSAITAQPINGFRRARMAPTNYSAISAAGYQYNSSDHPTCIPGRYNNLRKPRLASVQSGLVNIPVSVTPVLRIPMFWAAFKNFPLWFVQRCALRTLRHDGVVNFYWHPWEFAELEIYGLPKSMRAIDGEPLAQRLSTFIDFLSTHARFATFDQFAQRVREQNGPA